MQKIVNTTSKRVFLIVSIMVLALLGIIGFQQIQSDIKVEGFLDPEQKIAYGGGTVAETQGQYYAIPRWHDNQISRDEIDTYVNASNQAGEALVAQGVNRFYVGVTLRRYLSPKEFELLVKESGVSAKNYMLRATFPTIDSTVRVGMFGRTSENSIIDPVAIENAKNRLEYQARERKANKIAAERTGGSGEAEDWQDVLSAEEFKAIEISDDDAVLNGVFTFEAVTNAEGYQKLRANPLVYHVDVTAALVFQQLKDRGVKWVDFVEDVDLSDYDTFWDMENLGLDNFQ